MKKISLELTKAVQKFELNYKNTLDNSNVDDDVTISVLYNLGADIKHLFDDVIEIIENN